MTLLTEHGTFTKTTSTSTPVSQQVNLSNSSLTPKIIILRTAGLTTSDGTYTDHNLLSYGWSDGTNSVCQTFRAHETNENEAYVIRNDAIISIFSLTAGSEISRASISSTAAGSFTLSWAVQSDTTAMVVEYDVYGGDDITNVSAFTGTTDFSTGNHSWNGSGTSFTPDFALIMNTSDYGASVNNIESIVDRSVFNISAITSSNQWWLGFRVETATTSDADMLLVNGSCLATMNTSNGTVSAESSFVSFNNAAGGGITVNITNAASNTIVVGFLLVKGGIWDVGTFQQRSGTGTQDVTLSDSEATAKLISLFGINSATAGSRQDHCYVGFGSSDGTNESNSYNGQTNALGTYVTARSTGTGKVYRNATPAATATSSTTDAECSVSDVTTAGQYTLNWTTADTTQRQMAYFSVSAVEAGNELFERSVNESLTISASPVVVTRFVRSVNESLTISDSPTSVKTVIRNVSESLTIDEVVSRATSLFRELSETIEVADTVDRLRTIPKALSEMLELDDTVARMSSFTRSVSDTVELVADVVRLRSVSKTLNETVESIDDVVRMYLANRTLSESLTSEAEVARIRSVDKSVSESLTLDDQVARMIAFFRTLSETVQLEDTVDRLRSVPKSLSESLDIDAQVARLVSLTRSLSESLTIDAQVVGARLYSRLVEETLELADQVTRMLSINRSVSDTVQSEDSVERMLTANRSLDESLTIDANAAGARFFGRLVNETIELVDSVVRMLFANRSISESLTLDAQVARIKTFLRTLNEELTIDATVSLLRSVSKSLSETVDLADQVSRVYKAYRSTSETLIIDVQVVRARFINRLLNEVLELEDTVSRLRTVSREISETLEIDAQVARMMAFYRTLSETLDIDAQVVRLQSFIRMLDESLTITDNVSRFKRAIRSVTNSVTIVANVVQESGEIKTVAVNEAIMIQTQLSLFICWVGGRGPLPIIIKKVGRFFSILPQRNIRPYTIKSRFLKFSENQEVEP